MRCPHCHKKLRLQHWRRDRKRVVMFRLFDYGSGRPTQSTEYKGVWVRCAKRRADFGVCRACKETVT
jgi:hypothetical protein